MNLYEMTEEMLKLDELYDEMINSETGEIEDADVLAELEKELDENMEQKIENIVKFSINLNSEIEQLKAEKKRIDGEMSRRRRKIESLTKLVKMSMDRTGKKAFKTIYKNVKLTKGRMKYELVDPNEVPRELLKIDVSIKKNEVAKYVKKNGEIPAGVLAEQGEDTLKLY